MSSRFSFLKSPVHRTQLILCKLRKVIREWREDIFTATSAYPGLGQSHSPLNGMLLLHTYIHTYILTYIHTYIHTLFDE